MVLDPSVNTPLWLGEPLMSQIAFKNLGFKELAVESDATFIFDMLLHDHPDFITLFFPLFRLILILEHI